LVDSLCGDLLEVPLSHESTEILREAFQANSDLARVDQVHAALASIAANDAAPTWS
jgi:hypothetical protein